MIANSGKVLSLLERVDYSEECQYFKYTDDIELEDIYVDLGYDLNDLELDLNIEHFKFPEYLWNDENLFLPRKIVNGTAYYYCKVNNCQSSMKIVAPFRDPTPINPYHNHQNFIEERDLQNIKKIYQKKQKNSKKWEWILMKA